MELSREAVLEWLAAALPHLDLFAPAHDLDSLAALEPYLAALRAGLVP